MIEICRGTILVDPILGGQVLAQKASHNEFCRVWVEELGSSWFKRFVAWAQEIQKQGQMEVTVKKSSFSDDMVSNLINGHRLMQIKPLQRSLLPFSLFFPSPTLGGLLHII